MKDFVDVLKLLETTHGLSLKLVLKDLFKNVHLEMVLDKRSTFTLQREQVTDE